MPRSALLILALILTNEASLLAQTESMQQREARAEQSPQIHPLPGTGGEQGILKLDVLVTDAKGNPVSGLDREDFTVLDNGQPNEILTFHAFDGTQLKADPPVEVILFLDSLGLPKKMEKFHREEVVRFLRQNGGHLRQHISICGISENILWTMKEPSRDGNVLADQLEKNKVIPWVGGHRNEGDPFNVALQAVSAVATAERRRPGRKLLLWIGAGCCKGSGDLLPGPEAQDTRKSVFDMVSWASALFREAHMTIYSFSEGEAVTQRNDRAYKGLLAGSISPADVRWMSLYKKVLAIQSGGRVMVPDAGRMGQTDELKDQIDEVLREADTFYMLSIDPSHAAHPDEYHSLKVDVDRPGLTVRTKTGYYDQPYYEDAPDPALKQVTMAQVEAILKADRGDRDAALAKQISFLDLTERMSSARLRSWTMVFRGKKTRAALVALADASAFLDPPQDEVLKDAAPDEAEQQKMLALVGDYLSKTMPKLPNFFATRTTVRYEDAPAMHEREEARDFQPLHVAETAKAMVLYRNGNEVVESNTKEGKNRKIASGRGWMATHGTFGPMLGWVTTALASPGALTWSRWQQGADARLAVFHWSVPEQRSTYSMVGCCLPDHAGEQAYGMKAAFLGEVTIDPLTGAILRLQMKSDLLSNEPPSRTPESQFDIMIEYAATEIGGIPYVCPIRSVTICRTRSVIDVKQWDQSFKTYGPYWTLLSDATFDDYHRFRSEARIITDVPPADQ